MSGFSLQELRQLVMPSQRLLANIKCALNSETNTNSFTLCDDVNGDGSLYVEFVRHIVYANDGSIDRTYDTTPGLDADYVVVGTVGTCASSGGTPAEGLALFDGVTDWDAAYWGGGSTAGFRYVYPTDIEIFNGIRNNPTGGELIQLSVWDNNDLNNLSYLILSKFDLTSETPYIKLKARSGVTGEWVQIEMDGGGADARMNIRASTDGFPGVTYHANYSANYTDRSLVDKAYVDAAVAGAGGGGGGSAVLTAIKTVDESQINNVAPIDDLELSVSLEANSFYDIYGFVHFVADAEPDLKISFSTPAGATGKMNNATGTGSAAFNLSQSLFFGGFGTSSRSGSLTGYIQTSATPGNLTLSWSQFTSSALATTLKTGTTLVVTKLN